MPGVPTIRLFEALACGIPLVSAWWDNRESLFSPGKDFVMVRNGREMSKALRRILHDRAFADALPTRGLQTVLARHTCAHRVTELLAIAESVRQSPPGDRVSSRVPTRRPKAVTA